MLGIKKKKTFLLRVLSVVYHRGRERGERKRERGEERERGGNNIGVERVGESERERWAYSLTANA